jgi:hypothetical protein
MAEVDAATWVWQTKNECGYTGLACSTWVDVEAPAGSCWG